MSASGRPRPEVEGGTVRRWLGLTILVGLAACASHAVDRHVEALRTGNPDARRNAAKALAEMGEGARAAVMPLAAALGDPETTVRWSAAAALGRIGPEAEPAVPALVRALDDPSPGVRQASLWALRRIGKTGLREAISALIGTLRSPEAGLRWSAAVSLERLGAEALPALPELERVAYEDTDGAVRLAALEAADAIRGERK
jgi:HEAT repeat protein